MTGTMTGHKRHICMIAAGLLAAAPLGCGTNSNSESDNVVAQAYELRMKGQPDEAKLLLEKSIAENPDHAASYYELARTTVHMALGNPRKLPETIASADSLIDQAVEKDPDNVTYRILAGHIKAFPAYMAMQRSEPDLQEKVAKTCAAFEAALEIDPEFHAARLYLVELYGAIPEEMGGNPARATEYMAVLVEKDEIYGMKARAIMDEVEISDWESLRDNHPESVVVLEELGKSHLNEDEIDAAVKCFDEACRMDPSCATLFLDLGRFHLFAAMGAMRSDDKEKANASLLAAEVAIQRYLESEPPAPMKAYAIEMLAKVKYGLDEQDEMNRLREEALALDPHFSKATGSPRPELYTPPGEVSHHHRYLFRVL